MRRPERENTSTKLWLAAGLGGLVLVGGLAVLMVKMMTRNDQPTVKNEEPKQAVLPQPKPKEPVKVPFRIPMNGLAGKEYIDPIAFGPDWLFNPPGTATPWSHQTAFARVVTRAALGYPQHPMSRYAFETEITVNAGGEVVFCLGEPHNGTHLALISKPKQGIGECQLKEWRHGGWGWSGTGVFPVGERIRLKLLVGDCTQILFHENQPIVSAASPWPVDCGLRIWAETPDAALIHSCSFRPLTAQDIVDCKKWVTPPLTFTTPVTNVPGDPTKTAARLAKLSEGYPTTPKLAETFTVLV